jgi:aminopeptidase I
LDHPNYSIANFRRTWWDRDLGLGGRVVVKDENSGIIQTKLIHLPYPVARIPTLAPHFGAAANGPFNPETNTTPIIALEPNDPAENELRPDEVGAPLAGRHNIRLLRVIAKELGVPGIMKIAFIHVTHETDAV